MACAWDESNPNCLREIKSLKLLYPGVLTQTVDMEVLVNAVVSILSLKDVDNEELQALSSKACLLLLGTSQFPNVGTL